ncbi:hypothetical protein [Euryhalocaulis caribicus]|uniref:hypothetical protein n=1 Tax=Euryhalocaulis caribicus TaxID=1161401 RepID=UPI0003A726C3|nr:hypothetical protein [Euryhalocaulis caribicus]
MTAPRAASAGKARWYLWLLAAERALNGEDWRGSIAVARAQMRDELDAMPEPGDFPDADLASALRCLLAVWAERTEPGDRAPVHAVCRTAVNELMRLALRGEGRAA